MNYLFNFGSIVLGALLCCSSSIMADKFFDVEFVNDSGFDDNDVYLIVKALEPKSGKDCFMQFDLEIGEGSCTIVSKGTSSLDYSYKASQFKKLKIPMVNSGRIYVSVGMPMDLYVTSNDNKIIDSDGFKPRDPNYFTLHDKVEFSYNNLGTWINPTAVDYFSLPIRIEQPGAASHLKAAGIFESYKKVFEVLKGQVSKHDTTKFKIWKKLFVDYSDDQGNVTNLRFVAPGKAMIQGIPNTDPFDENFLNNASSYGFDYINAVWEFYQNNTLIIDASELRNFFALDNYHFSGKVVGNEFVFTNATGTYTEKIQKPSHSTPFFAGAGNEFDHANNTPKAIMVRQLTSAFEVGLLPAPDGTVLDKHYFEAQQAEGNYYKANKILPKTAQGPWYDLYAKALHSFGEDQPIYAFAYDDALGQDGTLHDPNAHHIAPVTIRLGNMEGVKIPDPFTDFAKYRVEVLIGHLSQVEYNGRILKHGEILEDVSVPFIVKLNGHEANIYIKTPMVRPYFDGSDGIVVNSVSKGNATISFPGR
ncbi:MAG: hypothetical protein H0T62_14020 [Parachlamydiaceae bacterium]|nr:hypothetical protein [Parachlamydiaceae bacterium]